MSEKCKTILVVGPLKERGWYLDCKSLAQFKGRSIRQGLDQDGDMAKGVEGAVVRNRVQGNKLVCVLLSCKMKQHSNDAYVINTKKRQR